MITSLKNHTKQLLLQTAREAIEAQFSRSEFYPQQLTDCPEASGVFVTVRVSGALRGCIGFLDLREGLIETVADAARRAAANDTRFQALEEDEMAACSIEITILGPVEVMEDKLDFTLGVHGLVLELNHRRGLLLPQVPIERGWTEQEFLSALCQKTGVSDSSLEKSEATLSRFAGFVISEDQVHDS